MPHHGEAAPGAGRFFITFSTSATIGVGLTRWMCPGGPLLGVEADAQIRWPFAATVRNMRASSRTAPGAGESYTYTLRVNTAPSIITCQTAGAVDTDSEDLVNEVVLAIDDEVCLEIVTTGAASVRHHTATLEVEPV